MDIDDEMKRDAKDIEDKMKKAMGENVYAYLNRMKVVYGYLEDENGFTDINLTDKERDKAIEFLISVLKEMGIEKTCKVMQKMIGRKDLTLLALGRAILDVDREIAANKLD